MNENLKKIVKPLMNWFLIEKRDLPWRHTTDSYFIWISETMLQQTRIEAVINYYNRFIKEVPTIESLASIEEDKLLKLWEGLGYYSRARNLKKSAEEIIKKGYQKLPTTFLELIKLPGIGPYTAGAISSIVNYEKTPAIDGNVLRVMTRLEENSSDITKEITKKEYFLKLQKIMPKDTRTFTESFMELGALICLPNGTPLCNKCPLKKYCQSYQHQTMNQFPIKKTKKIRKKINKTIFIMEFENKIAIQKRPAKGLLASLYEFPTIDNFFTELVINDYLKKENYNVKEVKRLPDSTHLFSHLEWIMEGYHITLKKMPKNSWIWVTKKDLFALYSIPNAFKEYLNILKK